eukprot:TRINITY_DN20417_c0_g1_i1.p1 TRINITY_DN20417_c0_g1~~TRINITY_DN20417_c0_g1_i1.p1  ORF type:complete len:574 (+),score=154.60 TRINITY_DN20417_c0_g1_i1:190-1911(+)
MKGGKHEKAASGTGKGKGKRRGGGQSHSEQFDDAAKGKPNVERGHRGKGKAKGKENVFTGLPSEAVQERVDVFASYTTRGPTGETVLVPACGQRRLVSDVKAVLPIDLALDRLTEALQEDDGSFRATLQLATALGLSEPDKFMEHSGKADENLVATLFVLLTVYIKNPLQTDVLDGIVQKAERYMNEKDPAILQKAQEAAAESDSYLERGLPGEKALQENFGSGGFSRYPLWALLAQRAGKVWKRGMIVCPRFVIVDIAATLVTPYPVDTSWEVVVREGVLFFNRATGKAMNGDWTRQGYVAEHALVEPFLEPEDRLLAELQLPSCCFVYAAAPDAAVFEEACSAAEPQKAGAVAADDADESEEEEVSFVKGRQERGVASDAAASPEAVEHLVCRMPFTPARAPSADGAAVTASAEETLQQQESHVELRQPLYRRRSYVEVKKTTHLQGRGGALKKMKFWMQARLAEIQRVIVAFSDDKSLLVKDVQEFGLEELRPQQAGQLWAGVDKLVASLVKSLYEDGEYIVTLDNMSLKPELSVQPGSVDPVLVAVAEESMRYFVGSPCAARTGVDSAA